MPACQNLISANANFILLQGPKSKSLEVWLSFLSQACSHISSLSVNNCRLYLKNIPGIWLFLITFATKDLIQARASSFMEAFTALGFYHQQYHHQGIRSKSFLKSTNMKQITSLLWQDLPLASHLTQTTVLSMASKALDLVLSCLSYSVSYCFPFGSFQSSHMSFLLFFFFFFQVGKLMSASILCNFSSLCLGSSLSL